MAAVPESETGIRAENVVGDVLSGASGTLAVPLACAEVLLAPVTNTLTRYVPDFR